MRTILAIDLGKFKSVACVYEMGTGKHTFQTLATRPATVHELIVKVEPTRVVVEVGPAAGWVKDLCEALDVPIQVANVNTEAWRWKHVKRKTDKDDGLKLAQLSALGELPTVTLPSRGIRQWRSLIAYRHTLVSRRTAIKNNIRSILDRQGMTPALGRSGWSTSLVGVLGELARPLSEASGEALWRGMLQVELAALDQVNQLLKQVESKLETIARQDARVRQLQTIPGVGRRLAETVVAMIDDPHRFRNGKQVGAYAGLVPRQFESGTFSRSGRITRRGPGLLRGLLVEVSWLMRRYNPEFAGRFDRICRGSKARRKLAVVATARHLLVVCWAMLRDGTTWRGSLTPPKVKMKVKTDAGV